MSSCIITIRNVDWLKREIMLYQQTDGHPNNMLLTITELLRDTYKEFSDHGDANWFLDPSKLAGVFVARSVPVLTEEMKSLLKTLPSSTRSTLESNYFLGLPKLSPEVYKGSHMNYEYSITLSEDVEESKSIFFGYSIEVYKLHNGRRLSTIMTNQENFLTKNTTKLPQRVGIE